MPQARNREKIRSELDLIARIRQRAEVSHPAVRLGIGDDCAILRLPARTEIVVTTDFSLEGRHFRRDWHTPESVGHRCLARGLSDIAAMGARPMAAFLSLALPASLDVRWVDRFLDGFCALAKRWGTELAGGDTSQAPGTDILADVVLTGAVEQGRALRRSGAREGDEIYVTGTLGGSAVELAALAARAKPRKTPGPHPHTFPEPRIQVGRALVRRGETTSCMDLSDGLSSDLQRICLASRVGAKIEQARLPLGAGATIDQALHGGEDYELLFTAPAGTRIPTTIAGVKVTRIGTVVAPTSGVTLVAGDGSSRELVAAGWEHFRPAKSPNQPVSAKAPGSRAKRDRQTLARKE